MPLYLNEPEVKRAVAFIDGQNLYRHAKDAFGHHHPNYDPVKLHNAICAKRGWKPHGIRFYTGTPDAHRQPMWHGFWVNRLLAMSRAGIAVFSRPIRYRTDEFALPGGNIYEVDTAQEKGVDVRIAIDIMRLAINGQFDVAVIFSQDQDLAEVVRDVKEISQAHRRWIKMACAYPFSSSSSSNRGIDQTDWIKMDQEFYNSCLDAYDYRPASTPHILPAVPPIRLKERAPY